MKTLSPCWHFKFIQLVTGKGDYEHLHKLFDSLSETGICSFHVNERIGQLRPIKSAKRQARMVRVGDSIPSKDWNRIAGPARRIVDADDCHYILLIDDLEPSGVDDADDIFNRYRTALDSGLGAKKYRAAVHFLVTMLEAYFFAHFEATNDALLLSNPLFQPSDDVEQIRNPKSELRKVFPNYNEVEDAGKVLDAFDLRMVLADKNHCTWLRGCAKWIVDILEQYPDLESVDIAEIRTSMHLDDGQISPVIADQ